MSSPLSVTSPPLAILLQNVHSQGFRSFLPLLFWLALISLVWLIRLLRQ
jgi:hypothetical protein